MRRLLALLLAVFLLAGTGLGCGSEKDKNKNSGLDQPLPRKMTNDETRMTKEAPSTKPQ